ncbi:MAG: hypothetical protein ACI8RD_001319, partial [Bacillariaceae sp.]
SLAIRTALQCTLRAQQKLSAKRMSLYKIMGYVQFNISYPANPVFITRVSI